MYKQGVGDDKQGRSVSLSLSNDKDNRTLLRGGVTICPWLCGEDTGWCYDCSFLVVVGVVWLLFVVGLCNG